MSSELLCKDCKHSFRPIIDVLSHGFSSPHAYKCRKSYKEIQVVHDPVIGPINLPAKYESCNIARLHEAKYKNTCGKEGIWWEPKNKKFFFLAIKHSER